jgi:ferredoxin
VRNLVTKEKTVLAVDSGRCVGAGQYVLSAPNMFNQGAEGVVTLLVDAVEIGEQVRAAVRACPSGALALKD